MLRTNEQILSSLRNMRLRSALVLSLVSMPLGAVAQSTSSPPFELSGGFAYLTNSFNGVPGARQALPGWEAAAAFPPWHNLRFKVDVSEFSGSNLGAKQRPYSILGGGQYEWSLHRERLFAQALFGETSLNRYWGPNGTPGGTASFTVLLGGGLDTRVSRHFAIRVEGNVEHTNFALVESVAVPAPYQIPGLPRFSGRISTGVVWTPRLGSSTDTAREPNQSSSQPASSEVTFESTNSFGHYHLFGVTWWSYLHVAGVEYDRHSWGRFLGARMDYVAEILPVVILEQPSKTDVWGNPQTTQYTAVPGLGVSPLGMRLLWREGKTWKPYYLIKTGMIGFTQKALSNYASYEDFTLQQSVGIQFQISDRWDLRTGASDFHFSNAFLVPSNPGIDEMAYSAGLTYHIRLDHLHF